MAGAAAGERDFHEDCLMRRLILPALVVLLLCLRPPVFSKSNDSAKALYEKGADAEARQNY